LYTKSKLQRYRRISKLSMPRTSRRFVYGRLLSPGNLFMNDR